MLTVTINNNKVNNIDLNIAAPILNNDANLNNSCLHESFLSDCKIIEKMFNDLGVSNTSIIDSNGLADAIAKDLPNKIMQAVQKEPLQSKRSKKKRNNRTYCKVDDEIILYKLADAGLLSKMHGLRSLENGNVYYFDRDPDVLEIVEKYTKANDPEAVTENTPPIEN